MQQTALPLQMMHPNLTLNFAGGSVSCPLPLSAVQTLETQIQILMERLRTASTQTGKRSAQPNTEYRFSEGLFFEIFCNPNLWSSPFAAKVLLTLKTDVVRISAELDLNQLREDIQQYYQNVA
jgi:hypothetical protein